MSDENPFAGSFNYIPIIRDDDEDEMALHSLHEVGDEVFAAIGAYDAQEYLSTRDYKFAQLVASGKGLGASYREAYSAIHQSDKTVQNMASRHAKTEKIANAVRKFRKEALVASQVHLDGLIATVVEAIETAKVQQDTKAIYQGVDRLSALMGLGKNQENKAAIAASLSLDADTKLRLEKEIASAYIESNAIDITPREV